MMPSMKQRHKRTKQRQVAAAFPSSICLPGVPVVLATMHAGGAARQRTFEAVAYSGGKLYVKGFPLPVIVDLAGLEVSANATILMDHDSEKRVGHPEAIDNTGRELRVAGVISAATSHADEVIKSAKQNYRWQMSIGARVVSAYEVPNGKQVLVNGRRFTGPVIVATHAKLNEISFVGSGGDEDNVVHVAAANKGKEAMKKTATAPSGDKKDKSVVDSQGDKTLSAAAETTTTAPTVQTVTTPVELDDPIATIRASASAEKKRIGAIADVFKGRFPKIEAQAIEDGWDVVKAELELMRAERDEEATIEASMSGPAIHGRGRNVDTDTQGKAIEASLCMQFGLAPEKIGHDESVLDLASSKDYRRLTLHAMMDRTMRATGRHLGHGAVDGETIYEFLTAERELRASAPGTFSNVATSGILSNVANKLLLDSFMAVNLTVPTIFGRRNVRDFKTNTAYRLAANGDLEQVGPMGEIKHADLEETPFTNQAKTWGKMLTLTRRDIINDDLGAFEQIPRMLGRKSAIALEKQGWTLILANTGTFFGTGNKNNISGATTALSIESLTALEQKFLDQTDSAGDPILLSPRYLVTGTALGVIARQLMAETRIVMESRDTTATAKKAAPASNPHAGKWDVVVSPFVNAQALTGSSSTVFYLFADPAEEAAFTVSYLNGRDTPMIESSDLDFNHLGMSWRVVFDFGVDQCDPRAAARSVGA